MRTAIYVRVSTIEQAEEGYSISEQIDKLKKYCEIKGWDIADIYEDGGFSGAKMDRPALDKMVRDAKSKLFDCVLVYKLDRLSRSQKDTLFLIEDVFTANHISFISLNENFDTTTPFGKAMIGILAVFAQLEREQIKERMGMGKLGRVKSGKPTATSNIPMGYKYIDGAYVIDPIVAPTIKEIFELYLSGVSITKLTDILNNQNISVKNTPWSYRRIRYILGNPLYAGKLKYNGKIYNGVHEPIITEKQFEETQNQLSIRQQTALEKYNPRPFKAKYMLSGMIRCGICGATLKLEMRQKRRDGTRRCVYRCVTTISKKNHRTLKSNPNGCTASSSYPMDELENTVLDQIDKIKLHPELMNTQGPSYDSTALEIEIAKNEKSLDKLIDLYVDGNFNRDKLNEKKIAIDNKLSTLRAELEKQKEGVPELSKNEASKLLKKIKCSVRDLDYTQQVSIAKTLIKQVEVYPDKLVIHWRFNS